MPKFSANLHYLFTEVPFLDRFEAAARAGFRAVEFQVPYDYSPSELRARLHAHDLKMVLFDAPMGDWKRGDRGIAAVAGREAEFRESLEQVLDYSDGLDCRTVHVMAGVVGAGAAYDEAQGVYVENLRYAARFLGERGITVVIEPINNRMGVIAGGPDYTTEGMHGYFLNHTAQARRIIEMVDSAHLYLHLDCYHMQMLEGNLAQTIRDNIDIVRHFQIAGVPGRHEPDVGEINYPYLFELMDALGYAGWVGCEYRPRYSTLAGLGWAAAYGIEGNDAGQA